MPPAQDKHAEYGKAEVNLNKSSLFKGIEGKQSVWASHTDTVSKLPEGFSVIASSTQYEFAGVADESRNIFAVQFHPEVVDTPCGNTLLENFLFSIVGCEKDWEPGDLIGEIRSEIQKKADGKKIIMRQRHYVAVLARAPVARRRIAQNHH